MGKRPAKRWSKTVVAYTAFALIPIYWLVVLSLQPNAASLQSANLWPSPLSFENYLFVLTQDNWTAGYRNAVTYVAINVALTLVVAIPAAYAFARYQFLGRDHAFFFAFFFRLIPPAIMIIPLIQMFSAAGLVDTHFAVAAAHCLFTLPIAIWILEGFIATIPPELEEAAAVDGYPPFQILVKILLPQMRTGIGVAAFFAFMFSWVELIIANALTTVNAKPIGVVLRLVVEPLGFVHIGIASAASVLMLLPGLVFAILLRKHLIRGFSMGRVG